MIQIDFGDHRPLYEQICDKIKELIISGSLEENEKIPSVRELAMSIAINPNTIQKAYKQLENEGYIYSIKARGSFVKGRGETPDKAKIRELTGQIEPIVRELCFLGIEKEKLQKLIDEIYEEDRL